MKTNSETLKTAVPERLALLAHLYLELRMPPALAVNAAQADLRDLDGLLPVEEAA
jgi:hypothetical protein